MELITSGKNEKPNPIHFDVIEIILEDGRKKEIYFDISDFFPGGGSRVLDPEADIALKLSNIYDGAQ